MSWVVALVVLGTARADDAKPERFQKVSFDTATNHALTSKFPIDLTLPEGYVVRKGIADHCFWGAPEDLDRAMGKGTTLVFSKIRRGVFWFRLSTNMAYDSDAKKFTGEDNLARDLLAVGITNPSIIRREFVGLPGLVLIGDAPEGKNLRGLQLALDHEGNVLAISYIAPPGGEGERDRKAWAAFVDGFSLQTPSRPGMIKGPDGAEAVRKAIAALERPVSSTAEFSFSLAVGKAEATRRAFMLHKCMLMKRAGAFAGLSVERTSQPLLEYSKGGTTNVIDCGGLWAEPSQKTKILIENGRVYFENDPGKPEEFPWAMVQAGRVGVRRAWVLMLAGNASFEAFSELSEVLSEQIALYDLVITGEENGHVIVEGSLKPKAIEDRFKGQPGFSDLAIAAMGQRLAGITLRIDKASGRLDRFEISGTRDGEPFLVTFSLDAFREEK